MRISRCLILAVLVAFLSPNLLAQAAPEAAPSPEAKPAPEAKPPRPPSPVDKVKWLDGPAVGNLGNVAQIVIPENHTFAGAADTKIIMEAMQNPVSGDELGFLSPSDEHWFIVFEYENVGYVPDTEKDSLDADAMLEAIRKGTAEGNKERIRRGWAPMAIVGWMQKPQYNPETHNLEWATRGECEGHPFINYNTRILGRSGVMRITLVDGPDTIEATLPKFKTVMTGFDFTQGQKYSEYKQGDKLAAYGLSALVVGGATAAAVKFGLFKWIWKPLIFLGAGIAAFFKKIVNFFRRNKSE